MCILEWAVPVNYREPLPLADAVTDWPSRLPAGQCLFATVGERNGEAMVELLADADIDSPVADETEQAITDSQATCEAADVRLTLWRFELLGVEDGGA